MKSLFPFVLIIIYTSCANALPWGFSAGLFHFPATDYYYPNFYDDAGYRGELYIHLRADKPIYIPLKGRIYGYPGDDNVFEYCPEFGVGFKFGNDGPLTARAEPLLGYGDVKLQYPAPYHHTIQRTHINLIRTGFDVAVMCVFGHFEAGGNIRYRYLWNTADNFYQRNTHVLELNGEIGYKVSDTLRFSFVGGLESGGWYERIFLRGNNRPYFELGVHFR